MIKKTSCWPAFFVWVIAACHPAAKLTDFNETATVRESPPPETNSDIQPDSLVFLEKLMRQDPKNFSFILSNRDALKVQVIYTQINRDAGNKPSFTNYYFHVNAADYFYPASTVKMPVALLSLQKLSELRLAGLDKNSSMVTDAAYSGQTPAYNDAATPDGRPTIAQYVKRIFLVSDNTAFNRLYEFLGPDYINQQLKKMGYGDAQIRHRLDISLTPDENRHTNPVSFYTPTGKLLYRQPMQAGSDSFAFRNDSVGMGYYKDGILVNRAMNFSAKNRIALADLHTILKSVIFPESVPQAQRFVISEEDRSFVLQYLSEFPPESHWPVYDSAGNWDAYGKFLYWGAEKGRLPKKIRIFNKEGDAYGFLTDISYFTDLDKKVEFMLSCTIYCNSDGILNDDHYDYEKTGLPFMKQLGRLIYDYELKRPRQNIPDLSAFRLNYEKN